jgi:tryptophan-rich sensory protein
MSRLMKILVMVATCLAVGYFASLATQSGVHDWFPTLKKPVFNPPAWVSAPVWSLLYILMGIAAGRIWAHLGDNRETTRHALFYFAVQLALNGFWSVLFFGLRNPLLALIEIALLWLTIHETWSRFRKIDKVAGWLFLPYIGWVTFAAVLNLSLWWMNR